MKKVLLTIAMCILSLGIYADEGKTLGKKTAGDFMVVIEISEDKVVEKTPTNFHIEVYKGKDEVEDAGISVNFYTKADGYVCPMAMDKDVQAEKPGKCPKCGMKLEKGKIRKNVGKDITLKNGKHKHTFDMVGDYEIEVKVQPKKENAFIVTIPFNVEKSSSCSCAKDMPDCDCEHCTAPKSKQASLTCPCGKEQEHKGHGEGHGHGGGHH